MDASSLITARTLKLTSECCQSNLVGIQWMVIEPDIYLAQHIDDTNSRSPYVGDYNSAPPIQQ